MIRERFARDVLALKPSVIVFLAGDNDIGRAGYPENTESDIQQMADAARRAGAAVLLCLLPPMYPARKWYDVAGINTAPFRARRRDAKIRALNAWLRGYAAANRLRCVDYYSSMRDGDLFLVDGTHPNAAGYAIMRATLEKQLRP